MYELRVIVLTVKFTDETDSFKLFFVTLHVPDESVVQDPEPLAPLLHVPLTVALASEIWFASCNKILTVAFHFPREPVVGPPLKTPICMDIVADAGSKFTVRGADVAWL